MLQALESARSSVGRDPAVRRNASAMGFSSSSHAINSGALPPTVSRADDSDISRQHLEPGHALGPVVTFGPHKPQHKRWMEWRLLVTGNQSQGPETG